MKFATWFVNEIKADWKFHCENFREGWESFKKEVLFLVLLMFVPVIVYLGFNLIIATIYLIGGLFGLGGILVLLAVMSIINHH